MVPGQECSVEGIVLTRRFYNIDVHPVTDEIISQAEYRKLTGQLKMAVDNLTAAGAYAPGSVYKLQREPF